MVYLVNLNPYSLRFTVGEGEKRFSITAYGINYYKRLRKTGHAPINLAIEHPLLGNQITAGIVEVADTQWEQIQKVFANNGDIRTKRVFAVKTQNEALAAITGELSREDLAKPVNFKKRSKAPAGVQD